MDSNLTQSKIVHHLNKFNQIYFITNQRVDPKTNQTGISMAYLVSSMKYPIINTTSKATQTTTCLSYSTLSSLIISFYSVFHRFRQAKFDMVVQF